MLVVENKMASRLGSTAKYGDGTRPRPLGMEKPAAPPEDQMAKALRELAAAITAQAGNVAAQHDALMAILKSNEGLARAVVATMTPKQTVAEEWSFEHVYNKDGDIIKTVAKRLK
jgi:hypothetical protein